MAELALIFGIFVTLIWIVVGWRAMRAHEKIAVQLTRFVDTTLAGDLQNLRRENATQHKHYNQFILLHPEVEQMNPKERHDRFRAWLRTRDGSPGD